MLPYYLSIEGNPFITRFKTLSVCRKANDESLLGIEGNPFITRFKTMPSTNNRQANTFLVLKVIHL